MRRRCSCRPAPWATRSACAWSASRARRCSRTPTRTVVSQGGRLDAEQLIAQVRPKTDWHLTATAAIAVENTHNRGGGIVQPLDELQALWNWSREADVAVHLDGARLFNASVASGIDLATYGRLA